MSEETHETRDRPDAALKTYRYLRISMIGVVVLLAVSVLIERSKVDCWQTSVSAYYYTPVRAIFVGGLMAVGLCLVVIKGNTAWEDSFLNFAGMLAPLVAVVPTSSPGTCWSIESRPPPVVDGHLAGWVVANIDNNVRALLITGFAGLVVAAVIAMFATRNVRAVAEVGEPGTRWGLLGALVLIVVTFVAFEWWDDFDTRSHGIAAVAMFAFLAAAVAVNAWERRDDRATRVYSWLYAVIAAAMVLAAVVMFPLGSGWAHMVLVLEATEVALFAAFWIVQTIELWDETP